jgi:hypothetical protein
MTISEFAIGVKKKDLFGGKKRCCNFSEEKPMPRYSLSTRE